MSNILTTDQVMDGIDPGDFMIDLSDYLLKKDGVSKSELQALEAIVATKLDKEPPHDHHIADIKELEKALNNKYDKGEQYSYNVILKDSEKIPYLEAPKLQLMELVKNKESEGYKFYIDESNDDLLIVFNGILVGSYSKASGTWNLNQAEQNNFTKPLTINTTTDTGIQSLSTLNYSTIKLGKQGTNKRGILGFRYNNADSYLYARMLDTTSPEFRIDKDGFDFTGGKLHLTDTSTNEILMNMAGSDHFRIRCSGEDNEGNVEFATADEGTEGFYFRQYKNKDSDKFGEVKKELILLGPDGYTEIPGVVKIHSIDHRPLQIFDQKIWDGLPTIQMAIGASYTQCAFFGYSSTNKDADHSYAFMHLNCYDGPWGKNTPSVKTWKDKITLDNSDVYVSQNLNVSGNINCSNIYTKEEIDSIITQLPNNNFDTINSRITDLETQMEKLNLETDVESLQLLKPSDYMLTWNFIQDGPGAPTFQRIFGNYSLKQTKIKAVLNISGSRVEMDIEVNESGEVSYNNHFISSIIYDDTNHSLTIESTIPFSSGPTEVKVLESSGSGLVPTPINEVVNAMQTKITQLEAIIENHYQALRILCEKHQMIDSDETDGALITPSAE